MKRIVLKFGGSSVETIDKMKIVAEKIIRIKEEYDQVIVIVSAMGKTTNNLYQIAKTISMDPNKRDVDMLLSTGEQVSIALLSMILNDLGCKAFSLTGYQAGIKTEGPHTISKIVDIEERNIYKYLKNVNVLIIAGFQGVNNLGDITTIGREGSDTSAVALAIKLKCDCWIFTDVSGVYSVDPKVYKNAKKLKTISYEEMLEMSNSGAKVIANSAITMAKENDLPIYIASTYNDEIGTHIIKDKNTDREITGISSLENILILEIIYPSNLVHLKERTFYNFKENGIKIDLIEEINNKDINTLRFTAHCDDLIEINKQIEKLNLIYPNIKINKNINLGKLSVISDKINEHKELINKLIFILKENNIDIDFMIIDKIRVSFLIKKDYLNNAINYIAEKFDL